MIFNNNDANNNPPVHFIENMIFTQTISEKKTYNKRMNEKRMNEIKINAQNNAYSYLEEYMKKIQAKLISNIKLNIINADIEDNISNRNMATSTSSSSSSKKKGSS